MKIWTCECGGWNDSLSGYCWRCRKPNPAYIRTDETETVNEPDSLEKPDPASSVTIEVDDDF